MNNKQKFNKIKEIKIGDINYPEKLLHIYAPPHKLYVLGDESILNEKAIAIIGCRNCSNDGERISYYFARELAKKKVNIVSGLARGIDSVAHKAVIDENIKVKNNDIMLIYKENNIKAFFYNKKYTCIVSMEYYKNNFINFDDHFVLVLKKFFVRICRNPPCI